jgi:hypothetical protein
MPSVSCFGAALAHHRPERLLSPLFIQMTCRFSFAGFLAILLHFSGFPFAANALRGAQNLTGR